MEPNEEERSRRQRVRDEVRPMWWPYFWTISVFDLAMIVMCFFVPNYAAVWCLLLVASWAIGGYGYKDVKYSQPLPDDPKHRPKSAAHLSDM